MRITNNMIMNRASTNINGNKGNVDATNTQMTTQKKIDRPSEDPVIAIRSLRLQTSLNKVNQYYEKNIPDAESWMDVTETALLNIKDVITDMRTLCVQGATGTLTSSDRQTILQQLEALQDAIYKEGNADYAGRTVFTGFRTDKDLTFVKDDKKTTYTITEPLKATSMDKHRYYTNEVVTPADKEQVMALDDATAANPVYTKDMTIEQSDYYRLRLAYDDVEMYNGTDFPGSQGNTMNLSYTYTVTAPDGTKTTTTTPIPGNGIGGTSYTFTSYQNEKEWENSAASQAEGKKTVGDYEVVLIRETGELVFGEKVSEELLSNKADLSITYTKQGFNDGELRPEYYFDCIKTMDENGEDLKVLNDGVGIKHDKYDEKGEKMAYSIDYTVAQNQTLGVNMEASDIFTQDVLQDMTDMIDAVSRSIEAHDKVDKIKSMMGEDQFSDEKSQKKLAQWLDLANKEVDYYDNNMSKMYTSFLANVDGYLMDITMGITKLGCKMDQLKLTEKRMSEQQVSIEELKSENDNMDLSEIILNYTAAYTAYQSSLTAAGKLGQQTLLNYI